MKKVLKPFQEIGRDFLVPKKYALLADDMGTGKTIQSLAAAEAVGGRRNLITCPASVRQGWKDQIAACLPGYDASWEVYSYEEAVSGRLTRLKFDRYDTLIIDEAHYLKSPDSLRTQAILPYKGIEGSWARKTDRAWALSGTPVLNRPREIFPILHSFYSRGLGKYNTWGSFTQHFCGAFFDGRGINTKGATNIEELRQILNSGFMLRRTKEEVLPELPPRNVQLVSLEADKVDLTAVYALEAEMANREAYLSSTHEDYAGLGDSSRMEHAIGLAKVPAVAAFVDDLLETVDKVVVYAWHRDVMVALDSALGHHMPVHYRGGMNDKDKKAAVEEFTKSKDCNVLIGQIAATGTGVDGLQGACSNCVFAEFVWAPKTIEQAIDRLHRMGQEADSVNAYVCHVPGTLESAKLSTNKGKNTVIGRLISGAGWTTGLGSGKVGPKNKYAALGDLL